MIQKWKNFPAKYSVLIVFGLYIATSLIAFLSPCQSELCSSFTMAGIGMIFIIFSRLLVIWGIAYVLTKIFFKDNTKRLAVLNIIVSLSGVYFCFILLFNILPSTLSLLF